MVNLSNIVLEKRRQAIMSKENTITTRPGSIQEIGWAVSDCGLRKLSFGISPNIHDLTLSLLTLLFYKPAVL